MEKNNLKTTNDFIGGDLFKKPTIGLNTLRAKMEPLFTGQSTLSHRIFELDHDLLESTRASIGNASKTLFPILESARVLGDTLSNVGRIAIDTEMLSVRPSYDFINKPLLATLNVAIDTVKINQERLAAFLPGIEDVSKSLMVNVPNQIMHINSLSNTALESLQSSSILFPAHVGDGKIENLKSRIDDLELKIDKLNEEKNDLSLTDITKEVVNKLDKIDPELAKCFKGAITTLMINKSEDLVAQVAESLTRIIENLPFKIADKNISYSSKKTREMIIKALGGYLKVKEGDQNNHPLILQQESFYITLSDIRHRNSKIYKIYNDDRVRFKALIIQVEVYIYTLLTSKNEN